MSKKIELVKMMTFAVVMNLSIVGGALFVANCFFGVPLNF